MRKTQTSETSAFMTKPFDSMFMSYMVHSGVKRQQFLTIKGQEKSIETAYDVEPWNRSQVQ